MEAKLTAADIAVSTILNRASPEHIRTGPTDQERQVEQCQALAVVERRKVFPALPVTPPHGPRIAPPPDRKRELRTSPEQDRATGEIVPYQHNVTGYKKGRVRTAPIRMGTGDDGYERIDRGDWESACEMMESEWPNFKQIPLPTADISTPEWLHAVRLAPDHLLWLIKRFMLPGELLQILDGCRRVDRRV